VNAGLMTSVIDYDDALGVAQAGLLEYQNALSAPGTNGHYRVFVPHCAIAAYGGTFSQFSNVPAPWIDCASTGVLHYGFKSTCSVTSVALTWDLTWRIKVEFRNVR